MSTNSLRGQIEGKLSSCKSLFVFLKDARAGDRDDGEGIVRSCVCVYFSK